MYLTTGPLYHSAPLGFMLVVQALGGSVVVQRHFDAEEWLRLVETAQGDDVVLGADAGAPRRRPARGGAGEVRHVVDAAPHRQRRAVAVRAEEEVRRAHQRLVAVRGLRLDRARREHDAAARRPDAQAGLVRQADRPASRSSCSTTTATRSTEPMEPGELFVRSDGDVRHVLQGPGEVREGQARRLAVRRRHRLLRRRGLLLHLRPQERHDHLGRREHLPGRDRGGARRPPRHRRRRRVRHPRRGVGRGRARGRHDLRRRRRRPTADVAGVLPRPPRRLQGAALALERWTRSRAARRARS